MGFGNPPLPWSEMERVLSGRRPKPEGDGGDSPAWSRKRGAYVPPAGARPGARDGARGQAVPYAELHCHSNFSFLDGASQPEALVEEAARLGLEALAITDHDGMYGVVRFAEAARAIGVSTVFGAELSLGLPGPGNGVADPGGDHLLVLARDVEGYRRLCRAISTGQMAGEKGAPVYDLEEVAAGAGGHWLVLTGCRKGAVRRTLGPPPWDPVGAARELDRLVALFGPGNVAVELTDTGAPTDSARVDVLAELAATAGLPTVATSNVHYATPSASRLAAALAAVRARRSLDDMDGWLPAGATAHLRSGEEMAAVFARYPDAVARAAAYGRECAFDLALVAPKLPPCPVPPGHTEDSWLRHLTYEGARVRYGPPERETVPGAYAQIDRELEIISTLAFPGYFLIVHDIVEFCRRSDILCQGRGSAANSAVCYALGITSVDAVAYGLLFERFLAAERDGPPDIDLDIESDRREEAIQYVYARYSRECAAQVANVITYRPRSAVRDMAKALGHSTGQQDAWSKQIERGGALAGGDHDIPAPVLALAEQLRGFPRHLGIHSGGMVICDRPVVEVVPVEWGRMADRSVLQWDKDDCAAVGLVKFDLLGLGMLSALHRAFDLIRDHYDRPLDLWSVPKEDPAVYDMLCAADSIGVFQVESRAQIATLPRLKPRVFYDLVVEVALIRPGPIQGGSVHPYIRRKNGQEPVPVLHPLLERSLRKTLGVPLFQEQLMQMAIDVAGFTPAESDQLRRAMGSNRSDERMRRLKDRLYSGMAANQITGALADEIYEKLVAFANYGFPESHAVSFALLVYASSWIKRYYPGAFLVALLNSQPMGFYSPQSLVADARRHGVVVRGPDINASGADARLERAPGSSEELVVPATKTSEDPGFSESTWAVRIGLDSVRTIGADLAAAIEAERDAGGPYADMADLTGRVGLSAAQAEALATAGAFDCFDLSRREALWAAGAVAGERPGRLAGTSVGAHAPMLPGMSPVEQTLADLWATGISPNSHPAEHARAELAAAGVLAVTGLDAITPGTRVRVGGLVTHRQRPSTAGGVTFLNLEDETGSLNVVCSPGMWARYRRVGRSSAALVVRGRLERAEGVTTLLADRLEPLALGVASSSRDFQ